MWGDSIPVVPSDGFPAQHYDYMKTLFRRMRSAYLSVSATTFGRVTKHVDHCPHCQERTPWAVRVLTGYARCLACGRNPLDRDDQTQMKEGRRKPTVSPRSAVTA